MSGRKKSSPGQSKSTHVREAPSTVDRSPLAAIGYRVGATGLDSSTRQQLLSDFVMEYQIPQSYPEGYRANWGEPGTPLRLARTIGQLQLLIDNAKRNKRADMTTSIQDWTGDIEYLNQEFETTED